MCLLDLESKNTYLRCGQLADEQILIIFDRFFSSVFDRNLHQRNCPTYMNFTLDSSDTSDEEFAAPQNKLFEPGKDQKSFSLFCFFFVAS